MRFFHRHKWTIGIHYHGTNLTEISRSLANRDIIENTIIDFRCDHCGKWAINKRAFKIHNKLIKSIHKAQSRSRRKKEVVKFLFNKMNMLLNLFKYETKIEWSNNKRHIPCSKIPHLSDWSNRFEDYTYRIGIKKIEKTTLWKHQ